MIDITPILQAVIALIGIVITVILIPYIKSRTTVTQQMLLQAAVHTAVYAAEQIYTAVKSGTVKKNYVLQYLNQNGITFDETEINAVIESTVKQLDIDQGK